MDPVHPAADSGATTDIVDGSANRHVENPSNIEPEQRHGQEWKPQKQELLIMGTMAITSLLVALDASILTAALPVITIETPTENVLILILGPRPLPMTCKEPPRRPSGPSHPTSWPMPPSSHSSRPSRTSSGDGSC